MDRRNAHDQEGATAGPATAVDAMDASRVASPGQQAALDTFSGLLAIGTPMADAIGMVAASHGTEAAMPFFEQQSGRMSRSRPENLLALLDVVAGFSPKAASDFLAAALRLGHLHLEERWTKTPNAWATSFPTMTIQGTLDLVGWKALESLPPRLKVAGDLQAERCTSLVSTGKGLRVRGTLNFAACGRLERLGDGCEVGGNLILAQCQALTSLPRGLKIGGSLDLQGCVAWDGVIPADAWIAGRIFVGKHSVRLEEWRARHPNVT